MFGHNDTNQPQMASTAPLPDPTMMPEPAMPAGNNDSILHAATEKIQSFINPSPPPQSVSSTPASGATPAYPSSMDEVYQATPSAPSMAQAPEPGSYTTTDESADLLDIKQKALDQLAPLVEHLDQNPEEKFHTTMMMIQANDDKSLLTTAYNAAQQITDDKIRAQALLDIVNEINYFTQK